MRPHQRRRTSMVEALTNTAVGFGLSFLVWSVVAEPLWGIRTQPLQSLEIVALFTVVSIVRGYLLRRVFERVH